MENLSERERAKKLGLKRYFSSHRLCKYGHTEGRYVSTDACVSCILAGNKKEHHRIASLKYARNNSTIVNARNAEWRRKNQDRHRDMIKDWNERNPGRRAEHCRTRQAQKIKATPKWLTACQRLQIQKFYADAAQSNGELTVDHIIPLKGKIVCGLHVPWNLQLLSASANYSKGAKFES